jgi:hypothetical protein
MTNLAAQAAAVSAIILLVVYLFGVTFGVFGSVVFGSIRESRGMSLLEQAPDPVTAGVRVLLGLFTRDDGYLRSLPPRSRRPAGGPHGDGSAGSHGQGLDR